MKNAVVYRYLFNAVERQQKELAGELQIIKTRAWIRLTDLHPAHSLHSLSPSLMQHYFCSLLFRVPLVFYHEPKNNSVFPSFNLCTAFDAVINQREKI